MLTAVMPQTMPSTVRHDRKMLRRRAIAACPISSITLQTWKSSPLISQRLDGGHVGRDFRRIKPARHADKGQHEASEQTHPRRDNQAREILRHGKPVDGEANAVPDRQADAAAHQSQQERLAEKLD